MRSTRLSVIAVSMMVVVPAVAQNSRAADSDEAAPAATTGMPAEGDVPAAEPSAVPKRKARTAAAAPAAPAPQETGVFGGPAEANHKLQTGLSIMPGSGYRLVVPYKDQMFCGDASGVGNKRVCAHRLPTFLDFQLAFGVAARADVILDLRFGVEADPAIRGSHELALAPGLRFWLDQDIALKFYTTLQFVYDHVDFKNTGPRNADVGMRNANGLMWDPIRNVGFFVQFGETIGFMRWFRIDLDIGLGAQIRFP
jgi:hypothetical protein